MTTRSIVTIQIDGYHVDQTGAVSRDPSGICVGHVPPGFVSALIGMLTAGHPPHDISAIAVPVIEAGLHERSLAPALGGEL